jgi:nitrogen fixation NifU-like protein
MENFSEKYMMHFSTPRNSGEVENPDGIGEASHQGSGCFDRVRMTMKVNDGKIADLKYRLRACSGTIAASSAITTIAIGKSLSEAESVTEQEVIVELDGIPERKQHSVELVVRALRATVNNYRSRLVK